MAILDAFRKKEEVKKSAAPKEKKDVAKKVTSVEKKTETTAREKATPKGFSGGLEITSVIREPRVTEKATMHSAAGVYVFDISERATKRDVIRAVALLYKVTPRKVAIAPVPTKMRRNMRTGKYGMTRGGKKAYIYLKKGEAINL